LALNSVREAAESRMLIPGVLPGGAGTRLWPVSREAHPKPFIKLPDGERLLLKALKRALATVAEPVSTVTHRSRSRAAVERYRLFDCLAMAFQKVFSRAREIQKN
jgi:mannose-1-phosphate guanylyltransferase